MTLALALAVAGGLGGCGRKAPNLPVEGDSYPRFYPVQENPPPPETRPLPVPDTVQQRRQRTAQPE